MAYLILYFLLDYVEIIGKKPKVLKGNEQMPVSPSLAPKINLGDVDFSIAGYLNTKLGGTVISKTIPGKPFLPNSKTLYVNLKGKLVFEVGLSGKVKSKTKVNDGNWHEFAVVHVASEDRFVTDIASSFYNFRKLTSLCDLQ